MRKNIGSSALALSLYVAISLLLFGRVGSLTHEYLGVGQDPVQFIWFLAWWPFSISHHLNPFISDYLWSPHGFNLTWTTSVPMAALLMYPVTVWGGPILSYNLLSLLAPALSAWTAFLLARHITRDAPAALVGGYLFGFSTYEIGQLYGHLNLDLTFLVPLIVLVCLKRAQGSFKRLHFIPAVSLMLLAELGISAEILATLSILGAITWAIFFVFARPGDRIHFAYLALDILAAAVLTAVLAAPFLFYMLKGLNATLPVPADAVQVFSADPLNYVVPTQITEILWKVASGLARRFTGNITEQGAYLGFPLILIMGLYFHEQFRSLYVRALLVVTCVFVVFSFGPWLQIAGVPLSLPLPWLLAMHLPLISLALPTRFTMYVSLCAALVVALWLSTDTKRRIGRFALAACACLFLAPNWTAYGWGPWTAWTPWPAQKFFTPNNVDHMLGPLPNVLILPFGASGNGLAWQIDGKFHFTMAGGYINLMPKSEQSLMPVIDDLVNGVIGPNFTNQLAAFCIENRVIALLLTPDTPALQVAAIQTLHWPQHVDRNVTVVLVPHSLLYH